MNRKDAISILVKDELINLTREKREELLLEWWSIDDDDLAFLILPKSLQCEILSSDGPVNDVMSSNYEPLLIEALKYKYIGVKNEYISKIVSKILQQNTEVKGVIENLWPCPCCGYKTLKERGQYEICSVCYWEDDGNNDLLTYSSPNHMTLQEYRIKIMKLSDKEKDKYINSNAE